MKPSVASALTAAFPSRTVEEVERVDGSWNGGNETVAVTAGDGSRAYLKVAVDGTAGRIARETAVLSYVRAHRAVRVPATVATDPDASVPYLVTAPAPGRTLAALSATADRQTRERLFRGVGRAMAALHAVRFDTHGTIVGAGETVGRGEPCAWLAADGDRDVDTDTHTDADTHTDTDTHTTPTSPTGLKLAAASWPDVLLATVEQTREIATTDRLESHFEAVRRCIEANRTHLAGAPAALLHGDVTAPNAFVHTGGENPPGVGGENPPGVGGENPPDISGDGPPSVGFLDWELAHVGDPGRDLVRACDQLCNGFDTEGPARLRTAVLDGYRERAGRLPVGFETRRPIYRVVRTLGRSGFLDQWADSLDEPVGALTDRIDAALDARLAAVETATR